MENYKEHACDVLYEYILELRRTDDKFDLLSREFYDNSYNAAMTVGVKSQEYNEIAEEAYCKTVNYLLMKNRPLVRAVLGTDNYPDMFVGLVPYLRD